MTPQEAIAAELQRLEERLLVPDVRKSTQLTELLSDDFIEFGSSGRIYTKEDLVAALQAESPVTQTTSDFNVASLAPDVALLTYKIRCDGQPPVHTLRSSVWVRSRGPVADGLSSRDGNLDAIVVPEAVGSEHRDAGRTGAVYFQR